MAAAKSLVALAAVSLLAVPAALADNPTVRILAADQQRAVAGLLKTGDLSTSWQGGRTKTAPLSAPKCPGFDPKESDLVVTGHADATFHTTGAELFQDVQVLRSQQAVATDFHRTISTKLGKCLAFELNGTKGITRASVSRISFPSVGDVSAAYRATFWLKAGTRKVHVAEDFVFFGVGRYEYALRVVVPITAKAQLVPFEGSMASMLAKRSLKPCC